MPRKTRNARSNYICMVRVHYDDVPFAATQRKRHTSDALHTGDVVVVVEAKAA